MSLELDIWRWFGLQVASNGEPSQNNSAMTKPRALLISPEFPYPPTSGGTQRTVHILHALAKSYQLDLLTFAEQPPPEDEQALEQLCAQIWVVPLPHHAKRLAPFLWRNIRRAVRGLNPLIDRFSHASVRQAVDQWLQRHRYDLVMIEHSWIAHYIRQIRLHHPQGTFAVLDAHNVESELWRQYYEKPAAWWHKPALYRYWRSARRYEESYLNHYDLVLAVSPPDAQRIAQLAPDTTVAVIPNGVDLMTDDVRPALGNRASVVGFIGSLEYPPNYIGLRWFLTTVWPLIKARIYDVHLLIIGRGDPGQLARLCRTDEQIRLVGYVPDLAPYWSRLAVMIVPLWHGSGTRIKILEAWAHGVPVVATSRGAEGLAYTHLENIWIADQAADFATAVVYLLSDRAAGERLTRSAWQLVQQYAWPAIEEQLLITLNDHLSLHSRQR